MNIRQHEEHIIQLMAEVKNAWTAACTVDGIDPSSKFVVLSNTTEASAYNELMGMLIRARWAYNNQLARSLARRLRRAADARLNRIAKREVRA